MRTLRTLRTLRTAVLALCIFLCPALALAHDIPADTTVRVFVKPDGQRLRMLVRVQMASINDVEWPITKPEGWLDVPRLESALRDAATMWISEYADVFENGRRLGTPTLTEVRLSTEGDLSFGSFDSALEHVTGPRLTSETKLLPTQGALDALFDYPITSPLSRFSFHPRWDRFGLRVLTVLHFLEPGGVDRGFEYVEGDPGLVRFNPTWYEAAWTFVRDGATRLIDAEDVLLLIVCLVLPFRRMRDLLPVAAAFMLAGSITLIAVAFNLAPETLWFGAFISTCLALSILYLSAENVLSERPARRWQLAPAFGLIVGFSLAATLKGTLQFAGAHSFVSVLGFAAGAVVGQGAAIALTAVVLSVLFRYVVAGRLGTIIISALAAHTAWHWIAARYALLSRFRFEWPVVDAAFLAGVMRWAMLLVALAASAWVVSLFRRQEDSGRVRL